MRHHLIYNHSSGSHIEHSICTGTGDNPATVLGMDLTQVSGRVGDRDPRGSVCVWDVRDDYCIDIVLYRKEMWVLAWVPVTR